MPSRFLPLLVSVICLAAPVAARAAPISFDDLAWRVDGGPGKAAVPSLRVSRGSSSTSMAIDGTADLRTLRDALMQAPGPVSFTLRREAGELTCVGAISGRVDGQGRCRFVSQPAFAQGLAQRSLPLQRQGDDLLALALLDARLASIDALIGEGPRPDSVSDVIAATALGISAAYARDLKAAGLSIRSFDDLVACRALRIDAGYVRSLTAAGYPRLTSQQIISMKAVGVTAPFATAMNAAARSRR